jgi:hypothetical protein
VLVKEKSCGCVPQRMSGNDRHSRALTGKLEIAERHNAWSEAFRERVGIRENVIQKARARLYTLSARMHGYMFPSVTTE